jgi:hypothetical protein
MEVEDLIFRLTRVSTLYIRAYIQYTNYSVSAYTRFQQSCPGEVVTEIKLGISLQTSGSNFEVIARLT